VIPPAWTDVWICPFQNGHLQVTARDARGRKQYRYHPRWRQVRDASKYEVLAAFARTLPKIRRRVALDLRLPGLPRTKVLAAVVRLLECTLVRVGNEKYVRANGSFGLTTLRDQHVRVQGPHIRFRFRGKSGKQHDIEFVDQRLAQIVRRCQDLPGYQLFQYVDREGALHSVASEDVNEYLSSISGGDYSAKTFRTWAGTVLAALALCEPAPFESQTQAKRNVINAIKGVASQLGNTASICRKCYVHPIIIESYLRRRLQHSPLDTGKAHGGKAYRLHPVEQMVLRLLESRLN
jgi:DNA topoisomerase-1